MTKSNAILLSGGQYSTKTPPTPRPTRIQKQVFQALKTSEEESGLIRTEDVRRRLGISNSTLSKYISECNIVPKSVWGRGTPHAFTEEQVLQLEAYRRRERADWGTKRIKKAAEVSILPTLQTFEDGEVASRCFIAFAEGLNAEQVVTKFTISPSVVMHLYAKWASIRGTILLSRDASSRISNFPWENAGNITTEKELLDAITFHFNVLREMKCVSCKQGPRQWCQKCVHRRLKKVQESFMGPGPSAVDGLK